MALKIAYSSVLRTLLRGLQGVAGAALLAGCTPAVPAPTGVTLPGSGIIAARGALGVQQPRRVTGARVVGRVDANEPIDLMLGLTLRDRAGIDELLRRQRDPRSADYRRFLTPAQFADTHGADAATYAALATTLTNAGFTITRRVDGRTTLSVQGPASAVEQLFGTELLVFEDDATEVPPQFRAPSAAFSIPASLSGIVASVAGLDTAYRFRPHLHRPGTAPTPQAFPSYAVPADLTALYGIDAAGLKGDGETVAILGTGNPPTSLDLKTFISKYSLPTVQTAQYTQLLLGGAVRDPVARAEQEYSENVLDMDMVFGLAPNANVVHVITATDYTGFFEDGITFIVNQIPQAHVATVSYGVCERVAIGEALTLNVLLMQAETQGQTWVFSAGDYGTDDCQDGTKSAVPSVDWPGSSPYAFSIGGTEIVGATKTVPGQEQAWTNGGGGLSELFAIPEWQVGVGQYASQGARMVPDVSALAGFPGVATYEGSSLVEEEGTSAAAPMWAATFALIDQARGNVGMPDYHERFYALGKLATGAFNDITMGANNADTGTGYPATVGYDLATGWGTPNLPLLIGGLP